MSERTYRKEQIKQVLERAVELQAASSGEEDQSGLSLAELEEVARASGIDPTFVQQAAAELESSVRQSSSASTTHIFAERIVEGELTDRVWEDLLVELRRRFGTSVSGVEVKEEQFGSTRSWTHVDEEEYETQVHVTPRGDGIHLRLSQYISSEGPIVDSVILAGIVTLVLGSLATALVEGTLLAIGTYAVVFILSFLGAYAIDGRWRSSRQRTLDELADVLVQHLQHEQPSRNTEARYLSQPSDGVQSKTPDPDIDLDELPEPDSAERSSAAASRRRSGPAS